MPTGRPSSYTPEIGNLICERLMEGESLRKICAEPGMPADRTVYQWLEKDGPFTRQYARAREVQGHIRAEMAVDAARDAKDAGLGRLAFDALRWHAGKLLPKVYGDRVLQEHSGTITVEAVARATEAAKLLTAGLAELARPEPLTIDQDGVEIDVSEPAKDR